MSNVEPRPAEVACRAQAPAAPLEVLTAREVPLGGPRAMTVRRTLPQRARSLIGAWCFADHYGPDDPAATGGMVVPPHPHTGLQTVSWLFSGEIEHRDSAGNHALVRPGELNLMTGGRGIAHSEVSTPGTRELHGVQLWTALPAAHRDAPGDFQHYAPEPLALPGAVLRVFLGSMAGADSPVSTFTPLLGAELVLDPGASVELTADSSYEHGVLVDAGPLSVRGTEVAPAQLAYLAPGADTLTVVNEGAGTGRAIILGGEPFGDEIVMWWNFVGGSHDDIADARADWERRSPRFGEVPGYAGEPARLPAPVLPGVRLRPRSRPGG